MTHDRRAWTRRTRRFAVFSIRSSAETRRRSRNAAPSAPPRCARRSLQSMQVHAKRRRRARCAFRSMPSRANASRAFGRGVERRRDPLPAAARPKAEVAPQHAIEDPHGQFLPPDGRSRCGHSACRAAPRSARAPGSSAAGRSHAPGSRAPRSPRRRRASRCGIGAVAAAHLLAASRPALGQPRQMAARRRRRQSGDHRQFTGRAGGAVHQRPGASRRGRGPRAGKSRCATAPENGVRGRLTRREVPSWCFDQVEVVSIAIHFRRFAHPMFHHRPNSRCTRRACPRRRARMGDSRHPVCCKEETHGQDHFWRPPSVSSCSQRMHGHGGFVIVTVVFRRHRAESRCTARSTRASRCASNGNPR